MPKSKSRKQKYARRAPVTQQAAPESAGSISVNTGGTVAAVRPATTLSGKSTTARSLPVFKVASVASELKVIGIVTVVILAAIFILYFVLR